MAFSARHGSCLTSIENPTSFRSVLCSPAPGSAISLVNSMIVPLAFGAHSGPSISYCSFFFIQLLIAFYPPRVCLHVAGGSFHMQAISCISFLGYETSRGSLSKLIRSGTSRGQSAFHSGKVQSERYVCCGLLCKPCVPAGIQANRRRHSPFPEHSMPSADSHRLLLSSSVMLHFLGCWQSFPNHPLSHTQRPQEHVPWPAKQSQGGEREGAGKYPADCSV